MSGSKVNIDFSEEWEKLPWKKFQISLFRLQKRLFKAVREGNMVKANDLQRLILKSRAARFLAIRQVTQLNAGKKTAGVDNKKSLTFKERLELETQLQSLKWKHKGLREIPIPKKDGTQRILKVPTIADRAWQCLAKYALEPAHEAKFPERSYGFRTGRSAHDAQKVIFANLNSNANGINKRVLELDIEKCFDRISHESILSRLIAPDFLKHNIYICLKAGINPEFPEQGTPQGGVVSPLLANISLNGIEALGKCIRYADDCVFILKPEDNVSELQQRIDEFLAERGMKVSQKKTKLTTTTNGFDFLGWNFRVQSNGKFRSTPSVDSYRKIKQKIKEVVNNSNYGVEEKVKKLAPIVRGWRNYHQYCKMDNHSLWHTQKRAFDVINKGKSQTLRSATALVKAAFPAVPYSENKHINVKGNKSPYDGDMLYWSQRNSKLYDGYTEKALKRQNHSCEKCGLKFIGEQKIHLHHIDSNHNNWKKDNLVAIHESCHDYIHMSRPKG
jgi:group II intron reverse transcriptase/maturase